MSGSGRAKGTLLRQLLLPLAVLWLVVTAIGYWQGCLRIRTASEKAVLDRVRDQVQAVQVAATMFAEVPLDRYVAALAARPDIDQLWIAAGDPLRLVAGSGQELVDHVAESLPEAWIGAALRQAREDATEVRGLTATGDRAWCALPFTSGGVADGRAAARPDGALILVVRASAFGDAFDASLTTFVRDLLGLTLLSLGLIAWLLRRQVILPIRRIHAALGHEGGPQPVELPGRGEIAEVARSLDAMLLRIAEQQRELSAASAAAAAANQQKTQFVAQVSHELRTPLTAILGYADLLADPGLGEAARQGHVEVIRRNGQHLLGLVNDVLDLSRIEANRLEVELLPTDVQNVVRDVCELMQIKAEAKGIVFAVRCSTPMPLTVETDPTRLRQIVLNLVSNAVKFTEHGSVTVELAWADGDPKPLRIAVIDTGIGLTPEQQARLFQNFAQADVSTARRYGGSGLGLSICRRLAMLLGGEIVMESEAGRGSRFEVRVGARDLAPGDRWRHLGGRGAPTPAPARQPEHPRLRGSVLVADDGADNRLLLGQLLGRMGLQVRTAGDGAEACQMVRDAAGRGQPFDLVLMDMQMPGMDGIEATEALRREGVTAPIVALTAHAMSEERERCLAAGCTDFAAKPIDRPSFSALLARHLPAAGARPRKGPR